MKLIEENASLKKEIYDLKKTLAIDVVESLENGKESPLKREIKKIIKGDGTVDYSHFPDVLVKRFNISSESGGQLIYHIEFLLKSD